MSGKYHGDEEYEPSMKCREHRRDVKTRRSRWSGISLREICLLLKRHPAFRWHELDIGFYVELGNLSLRCKGRNSRGCPSEN